MQRQGSAKAAPRQRLVGASGRVHVPNVSLCDVALYSLSPCLASYVVILMPALAASTRTHSPVRFALPTSLSDTSP